MWPVGQAVKTAASHAANGSSILPRVTTYALLAQLVEQLTLNQRAQGSSPWKCTSYSSIAQSVEHAAVNRRVVGSSPTWGAKKSVSDNRYALSFCKAQTTLCVHSRKNRRGAAKQNQTHEQNGAGRLLTAPEPSAPSGRCSEAEAGPETERCAAGESPWCSATISGLGMVVGSFCTCSLSCVSSNRYALSFCKAATTLCVNSCKNRRGAAKQNQTHEQNGAGRLFPLPEPGNEK